MAAVGSISEYEQARLQNIEKNEAKLRELNIQPLAPAFTPKARPRRPRQPRQAPKPARARTRRQRRAARKAGEEVSDDELGNVSLGEDEESSEDEEELQQDVDMSSLVAKLKMAGKVGGKTATKEEIEGAREAFKQRYMKIKGGTFKEWAIDRTIKEGPRADYDSKRFARAHFGSLNKEARNQPGHLPHLPVGTVFYSRAEMAAIGFHGKQMNGIDYCSENNSKYLVDGSPLSYCLTVISAGGYEDDVESPDGEWLWYTGEGGNDLNSSRRQVASQKMKGGNEALRNSMRLNLPVRLARFIGKQEVSSYTGIKYIYDGLYDVKQIKQGKGIQSKGVIQFLLVRQKNAANGKLRPNAVPPRHERILQLGARDGSTAKYEASAERQREEAKLVLGGGSVASAVAAGPLKLDDKQQADEPEEKPQKKTQQPQPKKRTATATTAAAVTPSKRPRRAAITAQPSPKAAAQQALKNQGGAKSVNIGDRVSVQFAGFGMAEGTVLSVETASGKFHVYFPCDGERVWIDPKKNFWKRLA